MSRPTPPKLTLCRHCRYWEWSYVALVNRCGLTGGVAEFLITPPDWGCTEGKAKVATTVPTELKLNT